jgi:hypothetical protein
MEISVGFDRITKKVLHETATDPSFLKPFIEPNEHEDSPCTSQPNCSSNYQHYTSSARRRYNDNLEQQ